MMQDSHTYGISKYADAGNGRKLHYMVKGTGAPTVVFESGMGCSRSNWGLVQPVVAEKMRAVVYDRAGFGRSDDDPAPRTLARIAEDLLLLLNDLGPGPFILVGHSWGGPIVRRAAERLLATEPSCLRGLVLVDPADENSDLYFSRAAAFQFALSRKLAPGMAKLGLTRLMGAAKQGMVQPKDVAEDHVKEDFTLRAAQTAVAEMTPFLDDLAELRRKPIHLGNLEVSLISGSKLTFMEKKIRIGIGEAHRKTVSSLQNGRFIDAPESGHMVMYSEPGLIVNEVLRMADGVSAPTVICGH
ncbi:alpha/beta fold hydrolase [Paenibacillus sp. CAU 1782]